MGVAKPIGAGALALAGAFAAATQTIAALFAYQPALDGALAQIAGARIYPPWQIVVWEGKWGRMYPRPFALAHLIEIAGGAGALVLIAALGAKREPVARPFGRTAWASFADAAAAGFFATCGTVLGRFAGEVLCFDGPEHQLLIGASRSGKGRGHIVPTLLAWNASAVVLDVKGELDAGDPRHGFPGTSGFRAEIGDVLRFAPTSMTSNCFNPLLEVRRGEHEVRDAQNVVESLIGYSEFERGPELFWNNSARIILTGVVLHVLYAEPLERKSLAVVREKLRDLDSTCEDMRATLHRVNAISGRPEVHPEVLHAAQSYLAGEERLRSGIKATAESFFGIFADPLVAANTARSDFRAGDLMCGERPATLYLQPPPSDARRLMPLMRLLISQIARSLMEDQTRDACGRAKRHRLLLLLDEFPQLGRLAFFETMMGAMAGYGLKAFLVCQSLNHIARAYGRDSAILDNCHVVTSFAAADPETARRIADMAGEVWEVRPQHSEQHPRTLFGERRGTITYREERRPLLSPSDVRALPRGEQLIFVSGMKPLRAKKLRFDGEPMFAARLRPAAPLKAPSDAAHDWAGVIALERLEAKTRPLIGTRALPARASGRAKTPAPSSLDREQADLFATTHSPCGAPCSENAGRRARTEEMSTRSEIAVGAYQAPAGTNGSERHEEDRAAPRPRAKTTGV